MTNYHDNYIFVIPTYNTNSCLLQLIKNIKKQSSHHIVIIEDGKNVNKSYIFDEIRNLNNVTLLSHYMNLGKGAALKTAFNYILLNFPLIKGVVTLDDDGQHDVIDALNVLNAIKDKKNICALGCRKFSKNIPLKSYIGNNISKFIYHMVLGRKFQDTQTGLRAFSKSFIEKSLNIKENRYEFETEQLVLATHQDFEIIEIPIQTIYIDNNKNSSFNPLIDSFRIYFVLFRYILSSLTVFLVDIIVFLIILSLFNSVLSANLVARLITIVVQFYLIKNFVFNRKTGIKTFFLFVLYVLFMGLLSSWIQVEVNEVIRVGQLFSKILIETLLFFINFAFLRSFLFKKK